MNASEPLAQFWDPTTSSVDWCEDNYSVSPYVVEFYNTLSSLAMIFFGEYGARQPLVKENTQFQWVFRLISVVGVGSTLFHATLKHSTQMMDELPMVWLVSFCLNHLLKSMYNLHHPALSWGMFLVTLVSSVIVFLTSGLVQFFTFHVIYNIYQFTCVGLVVILYRQRRNRFPKAAQLVHRGLMFLILAGVFWLMDTYFCHWVNGKIQSILPVNMQLHAWWHFFVSLGFYYLCAFLLFDEQIRLHRQPFVKYHWLILPEIVLQPVSSTQPRRKVQ
ncbi:hypothetical protein IWQ62_000159 [Dispira parvispora]|uniref:Alkaline phytoceramidase n=1 Tax=Dispira parvispora TaxID=1520584 RepID=A0A9W8EAG1_9FUNG|nr:hypothetical protein IWQ62_000159 [Dispira parvispora]